MTRAREAHALAKRRDDRYPRRRRKKADKGDSGDVKGTREAGKAKKAVAPARKRDGLKPKRGWEPIRL